MSLIDTEVKGEYMKNKFPFIVPLSAGTQSCCQSEFVDWATTTGLSE